MIHIILYISESMGEKFFLGAIQGLIGCVILYFWLRILNKKEKKQYEKGLKEEIYHEPSHQSTVSNNAIELDYFGTLYDELKEKCNPANYMNPYNAEKVEISNRIYSQLDTNKNNLTVLIELRNQAIKKLGLSFSTKELYDKLCELYNPNNYIGEKYDAEKLHLVNQIYAKIQGISSDIIGLEKIAKENGITLTRKKNSESQQNVVVNQEAKTSKNVIQNIPIICLLIVILICPFIFGALGTCRGKQNRVEQYNNDLFVDSAEVVDSMATNDDIAKFGLSTNTFSNGIYSIQYPKDWVVTKNINEYTDVHIGSTTVNIGLTILHFSTEQSLNDIQKSSDENMVNAGFDIVEKQELEINGSKLYETTYFIIDKNADIMSDNYNISFMSYILEKDGIIYNIKFGNCFKDENAEIARNIIKTFMFEK